MDIVTLKLNDGIIWPHMVTRMPEMDIYFQNFPKRVLSMHVLDNQSPEEVARAIITKGGQKEPFHLFDADEAYRRIMYFKQALPRVHVFYAMKAFDYDWMIKLAISQGLGFDCASPREIKKILALNVDPLSIIYAMPTKTAEQMEFARKCGVKHTTFDSSYELKKLHLHWPDAKLLIRIKVKSDSTYKLGDKFGCDFNTEAIDLLEEAASLGLNVVGVAFHVGSICRSLTSFSVGIAHARALFDHELRASRRMTVLDIGGGFFTNDSCDFDSTAAVINGALEQYFPDPRVQVIAEPGRYICDSSLTLYSSICNVRVKSESVPVTMIYLNEGAHGTLRDIEPWHTIKKLELQPKLNNPVITEDVVLWGPTCDSLDRVMQHHTIRLPRCTPCDWLVIQTQGAYGHVFATNFSTLEPPLIRPLISHELWNKIKECPVFSSADFIHEPDIAAPLPSTLPSMLARCNQRKHLLGTAKILDEDRSNQEE